MPNQPLDAPVRSRGRLLVFVHIPKTAGSTLRTVLSMHEPGPRSRALGNVFKGGGGISKSLIDRLRKDQVADLAGVGLVRGHFPLGIREYLPKYLPKDRELHCFTFLRQPADRTLSHYFQVREKRGGSEEPSKLELPPLPAEATVEDALERGYIHDNVQTRMLSGLPEPFGEVDEEMLEQAKHNLREELAFFGLTERFDESLVLAKRRLGFRSILYKTSGRVNTARPRGDEVPAELVEAAEACNRYDIELYRYAEELFEDAPERRELEFEVELAALRAAKANGEVDFEAPIPSSYGGDEETWRMLLQATATSQHLERELAGSAVRMATARSRTRALKQQLERLGAVPTRMKELEREVERLEAADARIKELEQDVDRLKSVSSRAEELEQEVERLTVAAASSSKHEARRGSPEDPRPKREARQGSPKGARPRPNRGGRQGSPKGARPRPNREARPAGSKRSGQPRAKRPASGGRASSDQRIDGDDG